MLGVMNDWRGCREPALCAIDGRLCLGGPGAVAVRVWRASRRMVSVSHLHRARLASCLACRYAHCAPVRRASSVVACVVLLPDDVAPPSSRLVPLPLATYVLPPGSAFPPVLALWLAGSRRVGSEAALGNLDLSRASGSFAACPPSQLSSTVVMALGARVVLRGFVRRALVPLLETVWLIYVVPPRTRLCQSFGDSGRGASSRQLASSLPGIPLTVLVVGVTHLDVIDDVQQRVNDAAQHRTERDIAGNGAQRAQGDFQDITPGVRCLWNDWCAVCVKINAEGTGRERKVSKAWPQRTEVWKERERSLTAI
ncbi:hypothetical protein B0H14DRAFT_2639947 [Mycena olivaceomarginata]|nr:hypothetical protein B0H14DRAFT_2639947 [Mycena olivaceomarginata]